MRERWLRLLARRQSAVTIIRTSGVPAVTVRLIVERVGSRTTDGDHSTMTHRTMIIVSVVKATFIAFVIATLSGSISAQEPSTAESMLEHMPCRAWTIMHDNDWSGQGRNRIEVETWTIRYLREYTRRAAARLKGEQPDKDWENADGADVDDRRIMNWITAWCTENPKDPFIKGRFFYSLLL